MWVSDFHIQRAVKALFKGKIIAYPTESVFGLGCNPEDPSAIEQLLTIKQRSADKGLILIASDVEQLKPWVDFDKVPNLNAILDSWPGPETWIIPARSDVSSLITGKHDTLAVRVSAHPIVRKICEQFQGPITSTSANKSNQREAKTIISSRQYFNNEVDFYVPGVVSGNQKPSRIRNAQTLEIIRS